MSWLSLLCWKYIIWFQHALSSWLPSTIIGHAFWMQDVESTQNLIQLLITKIWGEIHCKRFVKIKQVWWCLTESWWSQVAFSEHIKCWYYLFFWAVVAYCSLWLGVQNIRVLTYYFLSYLMISYKWFIVTICSSGRPFWGGSNVNWLSAMTACDSLSKLTLKVRIFVIPLVLNASRVKWQQTWWCNAQYATDWPFHHLKSQIPRVIADINGTTMHVYMYGTSNVNIILNWEICCTFWKNFLVKIHCGSQQQT